MATKATEKRFAGIKALHEAVVEARTGRLLIEDREEIALLIDALYPLGRTDRWINAIGAWSYQVRFNEDLRWAFFQYGVWAGMAAA